MFERMPPQTVKEARAHLGLTLRELSLRLGITEKTLGRWEKHGATPLGTIALKQMLDQET